MQYPSDNQPRNVAHRSVECDKAHLERKVREEQQVKNDAWLRADAVYQKEVAKLRKDRDDLVETLHNVQKKLELVEDRNRELMATLLESLHQQLNNAMNERRRQEVVHDKRLEDIQEQVSAIQEQVASDNNHNRRGHIDAINVKLQKDNN